ncbi:MAG: aspartyl protease family protein [Saprospiraceae bacterium]
MAPNKLLLVLIASLLFILNIKAQAFDFNQGGFQEENYLIELPYENIRGKIVVTVQVSGQPKRFLLDTGAPVAISERVYQEINPPILSKQEIFDIHNKKDSLVIVLLNDLKLDNSLISGMPAVVIKESLLKECFNVDGFIGSNALRSSVIQFDSKSKIIRIASDISKLNIGAAKGADIILDRQSSPILKIKIGENISEMLIFDSGADEFYSMSNENLKKFKKAKGFKILAESDGSNSIGLYGVAGNTLTFRLAIPSLIFNEIEISDVLAESDPDQNSRIGAKVLDYGIFTIDYKTRKSYFEPFEQPLKFREKYWTVNPSFVEGKLVVGKIWAKEIKKLISIGDPIVSINGMRTEAMTICDVLMKLPLDTLMKATIEVKTKSGDVQIVEIAKY